MATTQRRRLESLYGRKPSVPQFPGTSDPVAAAEKSAQTIDPFLPMGEKMVDAGIRDVQKINEAFMPGVQAQMGEQIQKLLSGDFNLQNRYAARQLGGGVGPSEFGEAQAFKWGTEDRMQQIGQAMGMASQLYSQTAGRVQAPSYQNMMVPTQTIMQQASQQWDRDWLAAQTAAAPDPAAVGDMNYSMTPEGKMAQYGQMLRSAQQDFGKATLTGGTIGRMQASRNLDHIKRLSGLI